MRAERSTSRQWGVGVSASRGRCPFEPEDRLYASLWVAGMVFGAAVEAAALKNRPGKHASFSAIVWLVRGRRFGPRWWALVGAGGWLAHHWLIYTPQWQQELFDR